MTLSKQSPLLPELPELNNEPTLRGLIGGLLSGLVGALRENKLAAILALFACVFTSFLAFNARYDERPRYRQLILPNIERAESNFTITMDNAQHAPSELWRLHYFLTAHLKVKDVLRAARDRYPTTNEGLAAHREFIRYYELVNEEISIIRTQMSVDEQMDYWAEWKRRQAALQPIRDSWITWVRGS